MKAMLPSKVSLATVAVLLPAATAVASEGGESSTLFTGDLGNIFWSLITFIVVVVVLGKFAWGPILAALQKREAFIRNSLQEAQKHREEAEEKLQEHLAKLEQARAEATAIVEEGRRDAEVVKRKLEEDAKAQAAAMLDRAKREISIATDTAVKDIYAHSAQLATAVASRILRKEIDSGEHERLINDSIEELGRVHKN